LPMIVWQDKEEGYMLPFPMYTDYSYHSRQLKQL